jgi:hypothetical protein
MSSQYRLAQRAVLMRVSLGLPGENRQDKPMSETVKSEHSLGSKSGRWIKQLFPDEALAPIKKLDNEARAYHAKVTLPYDAGIGILPAPLIMEYGDKMREFSGQRANLVETHFLARYQEWVDWAKVEHNGTFDASLYPGVEDARERFYFKTEPVPIPDAEHYKSEISALLGVDAESVNVRIADATVEAQRELLRRMIGPVKAMAEKLCEQPKNGKQDIVFRDTLIGNITEIAELAPKLNVGGDAAVDAFCSDMWALATYKPDTLREDKTVRSEAAAKAAEIAKRMSAYKI